MPRILSRARRVRLSSGCRSSSWEPTSARAPSVRAQPWSPPKGEGTVSVTYQNYYVTGHFDLLGHENTNGATHNKSLAAEIDVGLTDTLGLSVSLPFIASKYTGPPSYRRRRNPDVIPGPLDDGTYHGAFQDFRRRDATPVPDAALWPWRRLSVSRFHRTSTRRVGEAVPGRRRPELQLGATAGVPLDEVLPALYVQVRYGIGAAPPLQGFSAVRSNINLEAGCAVTARLAFRGLFDWQFRLKGPLAPQLAKRLGEPRSLHRRRLLQRRSGHDDLADAFDRH